MSATSDYAVARERDGALRLDRKTEPYPGPVAHIKPVQDGSGDIIGWRLKPLVTLHGARRKLWTSAADAIAATRLMTLAQARRAVAAVDPHPSSADQRAAP